jgi:hypothetical protein
MGMFQQYASCGVKLLDIRLSATPDRRKARACQAPRKVVLILGKKRPVRSMYAL